MRDTRHIRLWHPIAVTGLLLAALAAQGCSDDSNGTTSSATTASSSSSSSGTGGAGGAGGSGGQGGTGGSGGSGGGGTNSVTPAANGTQFKHPFDATPDPAGNIVYFTAFDTNGAPAVFKAKLDGSAPATVMVAGDPLVLPVNLATSTDGGTLFIADTGADNGTDDAGRIFSLANDGATLTPLTAADNYRPHGLEIRVEGTKDMIYFAGTDPTTKEKGIFKVPADGGTVTAVAKGKPFVDPSGIVMDGDGVVYVCDTVQDASGQASLISVTPAGVTKVLVSDIRAGYPCGVSLTSDETRALVSSHDPATDKSAVSVVDIAAQSVSFFAMSGMTQEIESGGLHAAKAAKGTYAWAGVTSGAAGSGTIYKVNLF